MRRRIDFRHLTTRELVVFGLPTLLVVLAGFWLASRFIKPAPPDHIVIATGGEGGAYHAFAKRYADILARDGVTLEVRTSAGTPENLKLLSDPAGDVQLALVQSGIRPPDRPEDAPRILKLASVAYEPLWVFVRSPSRIDHLRELRGLRLAVGVEGSGTRLLANTLLAANGLDAPPTRLLPLGGQAAADALEKREVDAAFFVAAPESPLVRGLLERPGLQLVNFASAEAYVRRFPFLTRLTLPQGAISFTADIPPRDIELLSPTALLVARDDTHPALISLMLKAASEVHKEAGLFQRAGEFPAIAPGDFELSPEAERYFRQGLPFLQRVFPFWIANLIERLWVLLVPVIALVIPLMRIVPPLYAWRVKSRVFRRYGELRYLESELDHGSPDRAALQAMLGRVERLERELTELPVPLAFSDFLYTFRVHLGLVRGKILDRMAAADGAVASPAESAGR